MNPLSKPELSIILITYNQSAYIEKAIQGLLSQDYDFRKVEIVVADDLSTDNTLDVIKSLLPEDLFFRVNYLNSSRNHGITRNYERAIAACEGEFTAILEGDDYWTSTSKLNKQVRLLKRRHEFCACGSNYYIYDVLNCTFELRVRSLHGYSAVSAPLLIDDNLPGNFSTMVYRSVALRSLPEAVFGLRAFDWIFHILISQDSQICVLHEPMSVYRVQSSGQWSGLDNISKLKQMASDIESYIPLCNESIQDLFKVRMSKLRHEIKLLSLPLPLRVLTPSYLRLIARMSIPPVISSLFKMLTPPIFSMVSRKINSGLLRIRGRK